METLLIIIVVILLLGGGGWYGPGALVLGPNKTTR
jgi:hypothetical protein